MGKSMKTSGLICMIIMFMSVSSAMAADDTSLSETNKLALQQLLGDNTSAQDNGGYSELEKTCKMLWDAKGHAQIQLDDWTYNCSFGDISQFTCNHWISYYTDMRDKAQALYKFWKCADHFGPSRTSTWSEGSIGDLDTIKEYDELVFALDDMLSPNTFQP